MKHASVSFVMLTLGIVSGCTQTTSLIEHEKAAKTEANNAAQLFYVEQKVVQNTLIKVNRQQNLSRDEQINLAVEAAVDDRVTPILNQQPMRNVVYFKYSSPAVQHKWSGLLSQHADYMSTDLSIRLLVAGFTDFKGAADFNLKLGQKRADNVCDELIKLGVRKEQVTCVSYGETHPADPGLDEQSRTRNRRVELLY